MMRLCLLQLLAFNTLEHSQLHLRLLEHKSKPQHSKLPIHKLLSKLLSKLQLSKLPPSKLLTRELLFSLQLRQTWSFHLGIQIRLLRCLRSLLSFNSLLLSQLLSRFFQIPALLFLVSIGKLPSRTLPSGKLPSRKLKLQCSSLKLQTSTLPFRKVPSSKLKLRSSTLQSTTLQPTTLQSSTLESSTLQSSTLLNQLQLCNLPVQCFRPTSQQASSSIVTS
jgi:hypothetical protein